MLFRSLYITLSININIIKLTPQNPPEMIKFITELMFITFISGLKACPPKPPAKLTTMIQLK